MKEVGAVKARTPPPCSLVPPERIAETKNGGEYMWMGKGKEAPPPSKVTRAV